MPRRSKKNVPDREPTPVADTLEALAEKHGLKPASQALTQLDPPTAALSFTERVRPDGPRKRRPGEPGSVFTSVSGGFKLTDDGKERAFKFSDELPPSADEKAAMIDAGLSYRPVEKKWSAPATAESREATDRLAIEIAGKDIGHGR